MRQAISARRVVHTLHVAHNGLGSAGVVDLFQWLVSAQGRRYRFQIEDIDLTDNRFGDEGLAAISNYLRDNRKLKTLVLTKVYPQGTRFSVHICSISALCFSQNNLEWTASTLLNFVEALNSSRLETLALNTMSGGQIFVPYIFSRLDMPYLKTFKASMTTITSDAAPAIASFISSPRCRLRHLALSANSLGTEGIDIIVNAMERNFSLRVVELFGDGDLSYSKRKGNFERRNERLQDCVAREAIQLLRYARLLLMPGGNRADTPSSAATLARPTFDGLPLELKQHILTFIAPHLSTSQCLQVFNFASSPSTLPLLNLNSPMSCLPDPSAMLFGLTGSMRSPCENGCIGLTNSLLCRNEAVRSNWLLKVRCDLPDPDSVPAQLPSPVES